jgi:hypothetical protein
MADIQTWSKELPAFSFPRLIDCPLQPGNLKISETACLKRYRVAQIRNIGNGNGENMFSYFLNQGLLKCQRCPIVKTMASQFNPGMSGKGLDLMARGRLDSLSNHNPLGRQTYYNYLILGA